MVKSKLITFYVTKEDIDLIDKLSNMTGSEISEEIVEKCKSISYESINQQITLLNTEFVQLYEEKYRALLQLTGSTFEAISVETQQQADRMLSFGKKSRHP